MSECDNVILRFEQSHRDGRVWWSGVVKHWGIRGIYGGWTYIRASLHQTVTARVNCLC